MKLTLILAALGLTACAPATVTTVVASAQAAYAFCQARGLEIAERLDPISTLDGPGYVRVVCGPDEVEP